MRYYKHLYLTEGLEKKKEKIIRKLEAGKLQPGVHVITLAVSERNQLEIYPTIQFKQPAFPEQELFVVGITKGYDEAVELVEQIVQEVYDQTGTCDIRSYILEKEQGREDGVTYSFDHFKNNRDHNCGASRTDTFTSGDSFVCSGQIPHGGVDARRDKRKYRTRARDVAFAPDTDRCIL